MSGKKPATKNISEIFKKTCYICGDLGHYADQCKEKERLCYNCKSKDHKARDCSEPNIRSHKQCYLCKQVGHIQSECPQLEMLNNRQEQMQQIFDTQMSQWQYSMEMKQYYDELNKKQ